MFQPNNRNLMDNYNQAICDEHDPIVFRLQFVVC